MKQNALYMAVVLGMSLIGASAVANADDQNVTGSGPSLNLGNLKLTIGGFLAAETVYRNRDEVADIGSKWAPIYPSSDAYHISDFRMTGRQSRLSLLVQGPKLDGGKAEAYYEGDFLGVGTTSNSTESNSYVPRVRQLFLDYATDGGFQVLAGQAWSLVTQNKVGIQARKENVPMTIDAQYVPGFNWTRNPQLRVVQNFNDVVAVGASLESPQAIVGGKAPTPTPTTTINGGSLMNSNQAYTVDGLPDIVAKVAVDPGFGHYEVFGLSRHFRDRTDPSATTVINGSNHSISANSIGGSVLLPIVPKVIDFQASILNGKGIGRYGSAQLPDYTYNTDGSPTAVKGTDVLVGLVAHATPDLDFYVYGGQEKADSNYSTGTAGYGNPANSNATCEGTTATGACTMNVKQVKQVTVGTWYKFYRGEMGYLTTGLQISHTNYNIYADAAGIAPQTNMNVVTASFRYYPFQK